ncbi:MAG: hypothetical protein GTN39_05415 [Candidatus Aenigmarchaeota archaeon]|nr:hypothetical protein [Candidatus Aenigmarchaeota archaeon]
MLRRIQKIIASELQRNVKITKKSCMQDYNPVFGLELNIKTLLPKFKEMGINKKTIPKWIKYNYKMFGAYLAGVIDGDGDITIKRPKYPQCRVRITSGKVLSETKKLVEKHLNCKCNIESYVVSTYSLPRAKVKEGIGYKHYFYISPKNVSIFKRYVYRYLQIAHKRATLERFFNILDKKVTRRQFPSLPRSPCLSQEGF